MIAGVRGIFLGAVEEERVIVRMDQFSGLDGAQALNADTLLRLQRLVLVILINLTCYTELMLLNHHTPLPWQFVGEEEVAQHGLWDVAIFWGSVQAMPVILMVFYSLP